MALHIGPLQVLGLLVVLLVRGSYAQLSECGQAPMNIRTVGGIKAAETKIIGGQNVAMIGSWPWQVSIHHKALGHFCGGSLITREWVLSAAHCFPSSTGIPMSDLIVFLGRHSQELMNPNEVNRTIAQIIHHPDYHKQQVYEHSDVVLLKLSRPVTFTAYIRPVCLAATNSTFHTGTMSFVAGWGMTGEGTALPSPGILQEVELRVMGNQQCGCSYNVTDDMLCAGINREGKGFCMGDSGGGLVHRVRHNGTTRWVQSGVVSFPDCAKPNSPEVYARVSRFQDWINGHVNATADQPGFLTFTSPGNDTDQDFDECPPPPPPPPPMTAYPTWPPMTTPPPPVKPCESLFCGGPNAVHFSYFTYVSTVGLMLYSMAGFA